MNIYVIYKDGVVICATPLPRVVLGEFNRGADNVQLWSKDKLTNTFKSAKEFSRFINPRSNDDDEMTGGGDYEW